MAKIIQETMLNRLRRSSRLRGIAEDFKALAQVRLKLVGPHGEPLAGEDDPACSDSPLCTLVRERPRGCEHCRRFVSGLVKRAQSVEEAVEGMCDAGLTELCIPVKVGGETIGFLITGGYRVGTFDLEAKNRLRHLLSRFGIPDDPALISPKADGTRAVEAAAHRALKRWLEVAVADLAQSLDLRHEPETKPMPAAVTRVCAILQREFREAPDLPAVAKLCGLSEAYFSRLFHRSTGLRYVEYLNAVRINHACELLKHTGEPITEIAFNSGFQSLSQFNRVFRKQIGEAPREWRREQRTVARAS